MQALLVCAALNKKKKIGRLFNLGISSLLQWNSIQWLMWIMLLSKHIPFAFLIILALNHDVLFLISFPSSSATYLFPHVISILQAHYPSCIPLARSVFRKSIAGWVPLELTLVCLFLNFWMSYLSSGLRSSHVNSQVCQEIWIPL